VTTALSWTIYRPLAGTCYVQTIYQI